MPVKAYSFSAWQHEGCWAKQRDMEREAEHADTTGTVSLAVTGCPRA
jgi:hypothetical protein